MLRAYIIVASLVLVSHTVKGQQFFAMEQGVSTGRFIEPPRAIMQQLRLASEASEQGRFGDAVVILGDLLQRERTIADDELSGQDFFIDAAAAAESGLRVNKTLIGEARRLLSSMPSEAIEIYELRYGSLARKLLDDASTERKWSSVAEVRRRYFHTEAGRDATLLLIQHAILSGSVVQAHRLADALLEHPKLDDKALEATVALIESLAAATKAGERSAVDASSLNSSPTDGKSVEKGNEKTTSEPALAVVAEPNRSHPVASLRPRIEGEAVDFRMFGGKSLAIENAGGQLPLADPRYTVDTTGSSRQERALLESVEALSSVGELPPPSWIPLRVGNNLLMRTTERLVGVDFKTGKRVWEYPWFKTNDDIESKELELDGMPDEESGNSLLKQRVWNDIPYGRITSDGTRVYLLGDLAQMQVAAFSPLMGFQGTRPAETGTNSLIALDLSTEGKLVWQIGGDFPGDHALAGAFILGAPVPVDDALYLMAEMAGDLVLLCLDSATGSERWRQQLLAVESGGVDTDPVRRVAGASASYQDGMIVCSTGAGAIVAVDVQDRALMWGVPIERNDAINQNALGRREGFIPDQLMKRWWDATPMIIGETVFVTPIEADRLFAFDLSTGEKRWRELARTQTSSRYLAGVHDGTIILVGSDNVHGVNASTGKTVGKNSWMTQAGWLDSAEYISGLGMFGVICNPTTGVDQPAYFVPTTSNRIIAVSLKDGSSLAHRSVSFPAGNLVAVDGQIISQAATLLSVAHGQVSLEPKVAAALEANPDDVEMMIRKAQLLIEQSRRGEALKWLDKARIRQPDNVEVRQLSVNAMLAALREDFAGNANFLDALEELIDHPIQRAELIKLQVRAAIERNLPSDAVARLIKLSSLIAEEPTLAALSSASESETSRSVSLDSWINARAMEAFSIANDEQRVSIGEAIAGHLAGYPAASTARLQRMAHQFGSLPGTETMTRQLLQVFAINEQWLEMERLILAAAATNPGKLEKLSPWQAMALAVAYAGGDLRPDAAASLEIAMSDEKASIKMASELSVDLEGVAARSAGGDFKSTWEGELSVELPNDPIQGRIGAVRAIRVGENKRVVGRSFKGWQLVSDDASPVALRDPLGNLHPVPVDGVNRREESKRQAIFSGGLMIAILPGELIAVNLFELLDGQADPVLWRRAWRTESTGSGFSRRSVITDFGDQIHRYVVSSAGNGAVESELQLGPIVGDTFYLLQGNELIAMDAVSQAPRWRNLEAPRDGAVVCDGDVVAVVSPASKNIFKFDCRDGKFLSKEPLNDYQLWASTDETVLLYRDLPEGKRELVLRNPITGETLLEHVFEGLADGTKVFGRIVDGTYAVTLTNAGETLVWDLENAKVLTQSKADPIERLSGLHVLARNDSLVMLPAIADSADNSGTVAMSLTAGESHHRVDGSVWAISTDNGKILWKCSLDGQPWGCTMTQSPVSPIVMFSRGKSSFVTTGSRVKSLDVMAIDVRDGKPLQSLGLEVESFNNDIETRVTVQPPQSRVIVNIGPTLLDYVFGERVLMPPGAR